MQKLFLKGRMINTLIYNRIFEIPGREKKQDRILFYLDKEELLKWFEAEKYNGEERILVADKRKKIFLDKNCTEDIAQKMLNAVRIPRIKDIISWHWMEVKNC